MSDLIRVSCSGLCRICDANGRYLLAANQNLLSTGKEMLTPIGGALKYHNSETLQVFEAEPENEILHELRLSIPVQQLEPFRIWFLRRQDRELDPFRELAEELVDELEILSNLAETDVKIEYMFTSQMTRHTDRIGCAGALTLVLAEIYDITFLLKTHREILSDLDPHAHLRWVTESDIRRGFMDDQTPVAAELLFHNGN